MTLLALLLCACAIPVLAFGAEPQEEVQPAASELISPEAMQAATERYEAEHDGERQQLEEELATPAARRERESSQDAYSEVDASKAFELLQERFAPSIESLNEDPARLLTGAEVEKTLGPDAALISDPLGGREIVEGSIPLTSSIGGTGKEPVDLTLEPAGDSFVPRNPLTPTSLPAAAEGEIELGQGVGVGLPASDDHEAVQVGQMTLFYPETEASTDTMVAPVTGGVEVFEQIRSAESPDEYRFPMQMPAGARLVPAGSGGGAEVVDGEGNTLERVPAPTAVDSQGATVPTTMTIEGDSLVVSLSADPSEIAYPALLDPEYLTESPDFTNLWSGHQNSGDTYGLEQTASDLHLWSGVYTNYEPWTDGYFTFATPGPTAWVYGGYFHPVEFFPHNCGNGEPHGYIGIWSEAGAGGWEVYGTFRENYGAMTYETGLQGSPPDAMIVGIGNNGIATNLGCGHDLWLGGYLIQVKDTTPPVVTSVTGVPFNRWFDPEKESGTASVTAVDTGFGLQEISFGDEGAATIRETRQCTGVDGSRCPHEWTEQRRPAFGSGKRQFLANAKDVMGNKTASGFVGWTYADTEKPFVELSGQFAKVTEEVGYSAQGAHNPAAENRLSLPTYNLHVAATDGSNATNELMQSGVGEVKIELDGKEQPISWGKQTCPASESSCGISGTYQLELLSLSAGVHKLKVTATDRVGLAREREIEFEYIPATGSGSEYVLQHFPLPDGEGGGEEGEAPELAVNVINGNLVYHQPNGKVGTADASAELGLYYNSLLPSAQAETEWGAGWTLGEAPSLEVEKGGAEATLLTGQGTVESGLQLPRATSQMKFNPRTQDAVTKTSQGYELTDEGEGSSPPTGLGETGLTTETEGSASSHVEFARKGGVLSEVTVVDPGTAAGAAMIDGEEPREPHVLTSEAGGFAPGDLSHPVATATDSSGDVYVADAGHDRVQEFSSAGAFIRQWGRAGTGNGEFQNMVGIAVSPAGNVYVAEPTRIEKFSSAGTFEAQIGSAGSGAGQFLSLTGIAFDSAGEIFTLESGGSGGSPPPRVQIFSATGTYQAGESFDFGTGAGYLREPGAIEAEPDGQSFWIVDTGNNRLEKFRRAATPRMQWEVVVGSAGGGTGQFIRPRGIARDTNGNIVVADTGNDRLEEFSSSTGRYQAQFGGPGDGNLQFSEPQGLAVDGSGNFWVADRLNDRVEKVSPAGAYSGQVGGATSSAGNLSRPVATATDASGDVYVADAGHDRVQEFGPGGGFIRQWGGAGTGNGEFAEIIGIAVDRENNVFVAEPGRIQEFTSAGSFVGRIGSEGIGNGQFQNVKAIGSGGGNLWVLDEGGALEGSQRKFRVQAIYPGGAYLSKFEIARGVGAGQLSAPTALGFAGETICIADAGVNNRVLEFAPTGSLVGQFGSTGTGPGQFDRPEGVAGDGSGNIWVSDTGNDRLEKFSSTGVYLSELGSVGAGNGQFSEPKGIATDPSGNVWVADTRNDRVQKLTSAGAYSVQAGGAASAGGNLSEPVATTTDSSGDVYVADAGHDRVQEFGPSGAFIRQWGGAGTGNGQFSHIVGIVVGVFNRVYVAEPGRIEIFSPTGEFVRQIGSPGTGAGQLDELTAMAIEGTHVWALDKSAGVANGYRLQEWNYSGTSLLGTLEVSPPTGSSGWRPSGLAATGEGKFWISDAATDHVWKVGAEGHVEGEIGSEGTAKGQLRAPRGVAVDGSGNLWVADTGNDRVQEFSPTGKWLAELGRSEAEGLLLSAPQGISANAKGAVAIAEPQEDKVEMWTAVAEPIPPSVEAAPTIALSASSAGLIESAVGTEEGSISYHHSDDLLTAVEARTNPATYSYDEHGRLTGITLPRGTSATISYDSMGRVSAVTTQVEGGAAKTTQFEYLSEPRKTVVRAPKTPAANYEIAEDGSVLKWWNTLKAPEIEELRGSLWTERGEAEPGKTITPGDQDLEVSAYSPEGIASIQIIANGNQVVAEKNCEGPSICTQMEKIFVTETENWAPGILWLEVVVTEANELGSSSERFWDNVPYVPPSVDKEIEPPTFEQIQKFREEFGLDLDLRGVPHEERAIDERIFGLIDAWHEPGTPAGQVAQASSQRWGIPLRPADVAELEYRENYLADDLPMIEEWGQSRASIYAGYSVDHRAGGIIHVGFTENQTTELSELKSSLPLMAANRVVQDIGTPRTSAQGLKDAMDEIETLSESNQTLEDGIVEIGVDEASDQVQVGATDVNAVQAALFQELRVGAPINVFEEQEGEPFESRNRESGRIKAGDKIWHMIETESGVPAPSWCTGNFGAWERIATKPNGEPVIANFLLEAGHCARLRGGPAYRTSKSLPALQDLRQIGIQKRTGEPEGGQHYETDAAAIRLSDPAIGPREIFKSPTESRPVGPPGTARHGEILCYSGVASEEVKHQGRECGEMVGVRYRKFALLDPHTGKLNVYGRHLFIITRFAGVPGDSGAPVWSPRTGDSIGILSGGPDNGTYKDWVTPLVVPRGFSVEKVPGALQAPGMGNLNLMVGN